MLNIIDIEKHVKNYYAENNPEENLYHNIKHVNEVVEMCKVIAEDLSISKSELDLLLCAAWFHDIGHIKTWKNHEELGASYAINYLRKCNCSEEDIKIIKDCIIATILPHSPKNKLEEIICDADISHSGLPIFFERSAELKSEIEKRRKKIFTDLEWIKVNIDFMNSTIFFTEYAKKNFEQQKAENLFKLNKIYISLQQN